MMGRPLEQLRRRFNDSGRALNDMLCMHNNTRLGRNTDTRRQGENSAGQLNSELARSDRITCPPLQQGVRGGVDSPSNRGALTIGITTSWFNRHLEKNRFRIATVLSVVVLILLLTVCPQLAHADKSAGKSDPSVLLKKAQDDYDRAVALQSPNGSQARTLFSEALKSYEAVLDQEINNASVLFNAGNAAYRLGQYPKAIVYYRRALLVEPQATDIQQNLQLARRQVDLQIVPPTERKMLASVLAYDRWLAPTVWKYLAYFGYLAFWLLLTVRVARRGQTARPPMVAMALCLIVAVVAGRAFWLAAERFENPAAGVVARGQTDLLKGNGSGYQRRIDEPLSAGVEFELLEQRPDPDKRLWYRIRLADGTDGWILAERAMLI